MLHPSQIQPAKSQTTKVMVLGGRDLGKYLDHKDRAFMNRIIKQTLIKSSSREIPLPLLPHEVIVK